MFVRDEWRARRMPDCAGPPAATHSWPIDARVAVLAKVKRERLIVDALNRGHSPIGPLLATSSRACRSSLLLAPASPFPGAPSTGSWLRHGRAATGHGSYGRPGNPRQGSEKLESAPGIATTLEASARDIIRRKSIFAPLHAASPGRTISRVPVARNSQGGVSPNCHRCVEKWDFRARSPRQDDGRRESRHG